MLNNSVPSSSESAFPAWAAIDPTWHMVNPNVDRAAPPRSPKKGKAKPVTKKPSQPAK